MLILLGYCCIEYSNLVNPLNAELNPICYLLALLRAHHFLHVSRIRVKLLTFRLLMSYIYDISHLRVKVWYVRFVIHHALPFQVRLFAYGRKVWPHL